MSTYKLLLTFSLLLLGKFSSAQNGGTNLQKYISSDSTYQIYFPGQRYELTDTIASAFGQIVKRTIFSQDSLNLPGATFSISEYHYPEGVIDLENKELVKDLFDATISGSMLQTNGILDYRTADNIDGFPVSVWRITYDKNQKVVRHKAIQLNNLMLIMQVSMPVHGSSSKISDKFMSTFRINKH